MYNPLIYAKSACRHPTGATMSNEVLVAGSGVGVAREGWRITSNWVGAGEQRKGKFDTNASVLPSKSS